MKRIALSTFAFFAVVAVCGSAFAQDKPIPKPIPAAKVTFEPPAGFKLEEKGDVITMLGPSEEVSFVLRTIDAPNKEQGVKKAQSDADAFLNTFAKDIKWAGKPKDMQTNGMRSIGNKAKATIGGKEALIAMLVIETPADKVLLLLAAVDATKEKTYSPVLQKLINSIKPGA